MKQGLATHKTIKEPAREIKVCREADVVVVGGGPAGVGAAVAAARNGAKTVLLERYGHLGGMAPGGLVILIPHMSDGTKEQQIAGLCQEMVDRLDTMRACVHPQKEDLGSNDKKVTDHWRPYLGCVVEGRVRLGVFVDPEMLKCALNNMIEEAGVKLFLHSWGSQAIVDQLNVQGILFESKSGRQAILAKVTIDTTGDGDIFATAGAAFDSTLDYNLRNSNIGLVFRVGHVDVKKFTTFMESEKSKYAELIRELESLGGCTESSGGYTRFARSSREDILWFRNRLPGLDALKVEDLTSAEIRSRKIMLTTTKFFQTHMPGFEKSFIVDTASQLGTRGSRRLIGECTVVEKDIRSGIIPDDTIAVCPSLVGNVSTGHPHMYIPYRSLVPQRLENLLVAGRCFSSDLIANDELNWIPHCVAMGQAAGTAAALAVKSMTRPREVDYRILQDYLINQGVPLPGVMKTHKGSS
jgi:hypothetical protein